MSELAIAFDVGTIDQALALDRRLGAATDVGQVDAHSPVNHGHDHIQRDQPTVTHIPGIRPALIHGRGAE